MTVEELKAKGNITRQDISELLASIGAPGEKQDEKIAAVAELGLFNAQGHGVHDTLSTYGAF